MADPLYCPLLFPILHPENTSSWDILNYNPGKLSFLLFHSLDDALLSEIGKQCFGFLLVEPSLLTDGDFIKLDGRICYKKPIPSEFIRSYYHNANKSYTNNPQNAAKSPKNHYKY
jgi:hypothetical protein